MTFKTCQLERLNAATSKWKTFHLTSFFFLHKSENGACHIFLPPTKLRQLIKISSFAAGNFPHHRLRNVCVCVYTIRTHTDTQNEKRFMRNVIRKRITLVSNKSSLVWTCVCAHPSSLCWPWVLSYLRENFLCVKHEYFSPFTFLICAYVCRVLNFLFDNTLNYIHWSTHWKSFLFPHEGRIKIKICIMHRVCRKWKLVLLKVLLKLRTVRLHYHHYHFVDKQFSIFLLSIRRPLRIFLHDEPKFRFL